MIEVEQGTIDGESFKIVQCTTPEEVEAAGLPPGLVSYYMIGNEKIIHPGSLMERIQNAAVQGSFVARKDRAGIAEFHRRVVEHQKQQTLEAFKKVEEMHSKEGGSPEAVQAVQQARKVLDNVNFGSDILKQEGHFIPTEQERKRMETIK